MRGCREVRGVFGRFSAMLPMLVMVGCIAIWAACSPAAGVAADQVASSQATYLQGMVTRSGEPVHGAAIWVRASLQGYDIPTAVAVSGPDGRYATALPPGTYYVSTHRAGHVAIPEQSQVMVSGATTANFSLSPAPPRPADGVETARGVLVGISDYAGTAHDLTFCDDDAIAFSRSLAAGRNWRPENLMLLLNRQATGDAMYAAMQRMATLADADDLCLFLFSGHGGRDLRASSPMRDAFLIETDMANNVYDDDLGRWVAELPTTKFMAVIAACYSGGFINASGLLTGNAAADAAESFAQGLLRSIERYRGISPTALSRNGFGVVITATRDDQTARESHVLRHDLLVYYMLQGMEGPADTDGDRWISAQEIHAWAAPRATQFNPGQHAQIYEAQPGVPFRFFDLSPLPPHAVTIVAGPQGAPTTVASHAEVTCSVMAEDNLYGPVEYLWSADAGHFDDSRSRTPVWTAPGNLSGDRLAVTISVTARSVDAPSVFDVGSFTVTVLGSQQGDVKIIQGPVASPPTVGPGEPVICEVEIDDRLEAGLAYRWEACAEDGSDPGSFDDPFSPLPTWFAPATPAAVTLTVTVTSLADPQHTDTGFVRVRVLPRLGMGFDPGISMVALPGTPLGVSSVGEAIGGVATAAWDALAQAYLPGHDPAAEAGVGCWARFDEPVNVRLLSDPWPEDRFSWQLHAGWNLVGNPWPQAVAVGGISSEPPGRVPPLAWTYRDGGYQVVADFPGIPGIETSLHPWRAYWLYAETDCIVTLDRAAARTAAAAGDGGWAIALRARGASGEEASALLGVAGGGSVAAPGPPALLGGPGLALVDSSGRRLAVDLRSAAEEHSAWEISLSAPAGEPVTISWEDLSALPDDLSLLLVDRESGSVVSMRTSTVYRFAAAEGPRRFSVRVAARRSMLTVSGFSARQVGGGASIGLALSAPADLTVEVRNIAGRTVRTIVRDRHTPGGAQTLSWNLRSEAGTAVPPGRYLVHLRARSDSGEAISALAPFEITR